MKTRTRLPIVLLLVGCCPLFAQMPLPAKIVSGQGTLRIDSHFTVSLQDPTDSRLRSAALRFLSNLSRQTGIPIRPTVQTDATSIFQIESRNPGPAVDALNEDESYVLDVSSTRAQLSAHTTVGVIRGLETFRQLVVGDGVPAVHIEDAPRFAWRGLLIDVTSHFMPVAVIERNLDAMAAVKLNVFHWHLADDQGFRIESKRFPKLHQLGSDGDYYTQDDIRYVIAYAHERGIRVVPELDMPGHCASWLVGYPELAAAPGPFSIIHTFGIYDPALDPARESIYEFLDALLGEITALFPEEYFHIGGDEVNGKEWHNNPAIQNFIHEHELQDERGLQNYFNQRVTALLRKRGKKTIGWDEVLHSGLPHDVAIQSWRDRGSFSTATKQGHYSLLSYGYYLDHLSHAAEHYAVDPQSGMGDPTHILGGEACMWTEYVSPETIDSRIWPRAAAIAERLWSPADVRDTKDMYRRLEALSWQLDWLGLEHRRNYSGMLERLSEGGPIEDLLVLADAVEPLGIDGREKSRHYSQSTPLNRLVDAARPESESIRILEDRISQALTDTNPDWTRIRRVLTIWSENPERLLPLLKRNPLLSEAIPVCQNLGKLGEIGLQALSKLQFGRQASNDWVNQQLEILNRIERPQAEVRLAAVQPVRLLVEAAAARKTSQSASKGSLCTEHS